MPESSPRRSRPSRRPLTPARQQLAERYLPLARAMARRQTKAWPWAGDEFESAASLALVEAAESFDPSRAVRFSTFARHRIHGALMDVKRRMTPGGWRYDPEAAPVVSSMGWDVELQGRVLNTEPDPPVGDELAALDEVNHWLRKLPPKHAEACRRLYIHGKTQSEAAADLGCSQSRLSCMHREALAMLNGSWYDRLAPDQVPN